MHTCTHSLDAIVLQSFAALYLNVNKKKTPKYRSPKTIA